MSRQQIISFTLSLIGFLFCFANTAYSSTYTVLNAKEYYQNLTQSRKKVQHILKLLKHYRKESADQQIAVITQELLNTPYLNQGAMGEGDWQPNAKIYKSGAIHINQNPVYRLDGFDCQTFTQVVLAFLYANQIDEFDTIILQIAYGAAKNPHGEIVHYYNRNHFIDGDFNAVNQKNGLFSDMTTKGELAHYAKKRSGTIERQNWFIRQRENLPAHVNVLTKESGLKMVKRFLGKYSQLNFPHFDKETITLSYIPKNRFLIAKGNARPVGNDILLQDIKTPAIAEFVFQNKQMKEEIGSDLSISHIGLLYRQTFKRGDLIYHKIVCGLDQRQKRKCKVTPITCQHDQCNEIMLAHATSAYPQDFYWYQEANGEYVCSPQKPRKNKKYTSCNRVEQRPFLTYLTDFQYGTYWHIDDPMFLGVHFEKIKIKKNNF